MKSPLQILHLEDDPGDVALVQSTLKAGGVACTITTVETQVDFVAALEQAGTDLIISDYTLPGFDGMSALKIAQDKQPAVPFIFVSGTLGEEKAIDSLKSGATDYVLKERLTRLIPSVHRAMQDVEKRGERQRLVERFRASELSYRRLFEAAKDGILILDVDTGRITDVNPFLFKLLGFTREEMIGKTVGELSPFKDIESNQVMLAQLQEYGYVRYENLPLETRDGRPIAVEFVSNVYQAGDKKVIQCNVRDITERKKAEQQLKLLQTCISNLNDIILITEAEPLDEPGPRIVFVNEAFERLCGYTPAEVIGRSPRFLQGPKTDRGTMAEIRQALVERRPIRRQVLNYGKQGKTYWLDMDIVPIFDSAGTCTHFAAIERDITEAKKIEEQLLWKTAFFEAQVYSAIDGILVVDSAGNKVLQNQRMVDLWDIPREFADEVEDQRQREWVISQVKNPQEFAEKITHLYAHPHEVGIDEVELVNGKCFERYSSPVQGHDGRYFGRIWSFRDITERKRSEARFRRLVDSNAQGVIFWNTTGEITGANNTFLDLVGYTRGELEAGQLSWTTMTPPEHAEADRLCLEEIAARGVCSPYEKEYIRKDGSRVPVIIVASIFEDSPSEGVCFVVDITERKKLEQQFLRAQRMESIGTLAGGIAHDLNNILAPILMSIDILKLNATDSQTKNILSTIEVSAKRGADIVRQVLSFARGMEGERIEIQPKHLLKDVESIIKDTFPKDIRRQFSIPDDTWVIVGDPTQVHQVLLNLCVNARDAMPHGGSLVINVENTVLDEQYVAMNPQARAGRYIQISVTDSGTGIPQNIRDKIFEPFFTTKEINKGTGLGLSTVMAIVKSHNGIINVYSEPGKGTEFKVYLPAMELSTEVRKVTEQQASMPRGNGETVLVVDDEESIVTITRQTLEAFGYRVMTASDGAEAVGVYALHQHEIDLVLTDMMMPLMGGAPTIYALKKINPLVKIIAASGLNANGAVIRDGGGNVKHFLTKPYTASTLLQTVRAILNEP